MESKGRVGVYIPSKVASDSTFPFKKGDRVHVRIDPEEEVVLSKT